MTAAAAPPRIDTAQVLGAAYRYIARGMALVPVELGGKRPIEVRSGTRFHWGPIHEPQTMKGVEVMFPQNPQRNIGIICGAPSGGLVVLDLDGALSLENVLDACPALRETWVVRTGRIEPGPGYHLFVRAEGPTPTITGDAFNKELALDVKASGSYVTAEPSLHKSGRFYETVQGEPEGIVNVGDGRAFLSRLLDGLGVSA